MKIEANRQGYVYAALTVAIWCGFIIVSRLGGTSALTSFDVVALRFTPAATLLLPIWLFRAQQPQLFSPRIIVLALLGGVGYSVFVYAGFKATTAAHAAVLLPGLMPFEISMLAWWLLGERPNGSRWLGLACIAFGIASLASDSFKSGEHHWFGDGLVIAASCCWSLYTVLARRWNVSAWHATLSGVLLSALFYLPIYALFLPKHIAIAPIAVVVTQGLYQGVLAVVIAMLLYMRSVTLLGPSRMGALMALVPVCAGVLAVPLLDEPMTLMLAIGLMFVSIGAFVGSRTHLSFTRSLHALRQH